MNPAMEKETKPKSPREVLAENDEENNEDAKDMDEPIEEYFRENIGSNKIGEESEVVDMPEHFTEEEEKIKRMNFKWYYLDESSIFDEDDFYPNYGSNQAYAGIIFVDQKVLDDQLIVKVAKKKRKGKEEEDDEFQGFPKELQDLGKFIFHCTIRIYDLSNDLCDIGAPANVMPFFIFEVRLQVASLNP